MFEKEAEERGNEKIKGNNDLARCSRKSYKDGFKEGAEFGYNKANEWHYVKDGDLPDNQRKVEVFTKDRVIHIAVIDSEGEEWYTGRYFGKTIPMNQVIAWKEIVLPKELEQ